MAGVSHLKAAASKDSTSGMKLAKRTYIFSTATSGA